MRRFHRVMLGLVLAGVPAAALAEDAVIRIEAKRGATAAAAAAEGWRKAFPDVVTFPLPGGWTAIALGPMTPEAAAARLAELKAAGSIPADSFVAEPGGDVPLSPAPAPAGEAPAAAPEADATAPEAAVPPAPLEAAPAPEPAPEAAPAPEPAPEPAAPAADHHIRIEAFADRAEADAALAKWREVLPEAGLWQLPNGWFAIAAGPMPEATAGAWLSAFKAASALPKDAFLATGAELGTVAEAGQVPDLPAPPATAAPMPDLTEVQQALRWAGFYDGAIDGKGGKGTQAAIAAEIAAERQSTDPGTAMAALIQRRADWRAEMGLDELRDTYTGLAVTAPLDRLVFDRSERALSIYGPKDGSGAALILFSQPGGQQELLDLSGLVTALGWVPDPQRLVENGHVVLDGGDDTHLGFAEGRVRDGRAEGFVLIWPADDAANQRRIRAELSDSLLRFAPAASEPAAVQPADAQPADASATGADSAAPADDASAAGPMPLPAD